MAMATASAAPAPVTRASRASETATSTGRVTPRARRAGYCAASSVSCRLSNWLSTTSAISAASAANSASATACGLMARWVALTWSAALRMSTAPPVPCCCRVPAYRLASWSAAAMNRDSSAPGRSRTAASSQHGADRAAAVAANGGLSSAVGALASATLLTTWLSNTAIPVTLNDRMNSFENSSLVVTGSSGMKPRRSVPPGDRCSMSASCWLITAAPGSWGPNICPASSFTRSTVVP